MGYCEMLTSTLTNPHSILFSPVLSSPLYTHTRTLCIYTLSLTQIGGGSSALEELVSQSEQVVANLSTSETKDENEFELEKRLRELNNWLSFHISPSPSVERFDDEAKEERSNTRNKSTSGHRAGRGPGGSGGESKAGPVREVGYESDLDSLGATHDVLKGKGLGPKGAEGNHPFTGKRCTITCFNPDGSPLQGDLLLRK